MSLLINARNPDYDVVNLGAPINYLKISSTSLCNEAKIDEPVVMLPS